MKRPLIKKMILAALVVAAAFVFMPKTSYAEDASEGTVYIENINVTGKSQAEVQQIIDEKLQKYASDPVNFYAFGQSMTVTAGELGLYNADETLAYRASNTVTRGNLLERFRTRKYVEAAGAVFYQLDLHINEEAVRNVLSERIGAFENAPVNMKITKLSDGTFVGSEKIDGHYVNLDESVKAVCEYLNNDWHGGVGEMNLITYIVEARGTREDLENMNSLLGTASTNYDSNDENIDRANNIAAGASKIDGSLVYPGEEFSASAMLEPYTAENGYYPAPEMETGRLVDSYGGGICQVSTTLYNAVLKAELEVTERSSHSMMVNYIAPSLDAAIAENVKDFKFINSTDSPIYIEGITDGWTITFNIYGHETRDPGREVVLEGVETSREDNTNITYGLSEEVDLGKVKIVPPHPAVDAVAYKLIYQNGELVSREEISHSHYYAGDGSYEIGIYGATQEQIDILSQLTSPERFHEVYALLRSWGFAIAGE